MNLAAPILDSLARSPDKPALTILNPRDDAQNATHSRAELLARAGGWAARLRMEGIIPGDRIAVALARDLDLPAVHLACLASALPIVPVNTALTDAEVERLLSASQPSLVIASSAFAARVRDIATRSGLQWWLTDGPGDATGEPFVAAAEFSDAALTPCPGRADDDALIIFTSGTTGQPKSVPLSHGNLRANLDSLHGIWQRCETDRLLHLLPAHHYHGLVLALYGSLLAGNDVVMMPRFDARAALDAIANYDIRLLMGVPTMYARMLEAARDDDDLSNLRLAISGSAPLPVAIWRRFRDRFNIELVERYGLTETGIASSNAPGRVVAGSAGRPLPGTSIEIFTDGRYTTEPNVRGEICIQGPSVMRGYGNDDAANAATFHEGRLHSGDLGRFDADGALWIDGRVKELIIVGGSNVVPGEVERALESVEGVREVAAAGQADAELGEVVVAFVVCRTAGAAIEERLAEAAQAGLAAYKRPRRYVFVEELPRNAIGKVDRKRLAEMLAAHRPS